VRLSKPGLFYALVFLALVSVVAYAQVSGPTQITPRLRVLESLTVEGPIVANGGCEGCSGGGGALTARVFGGSMVASQGFSAMDNSTTGLYSFSLTTPVSGAVICALMFQDADGGSAGARHGFDTLSNETVLIRISDSTGAPSDDFTFNIFCVDGS
jgi:hypothetical protein